MTRRTSKKEKGITLIALIITIIVLLILAGISIAMLTGRNGVLTQSINATTRTKESQAKEAFSLAYSGANIDFYTERTSGNTISGVSESDWITLKMINDNLDNDYTLCNQAGENLTDEELSKSVSETKDTGIYLLKDEQIYKVTYTIESSTLANINTKMVDKTEVAISSDEITVNVDGETVTITAENASNYYGWKVTNYKPKDAEGNETDTAGVYRIFYYDAAGDYGTSGTLYLKRHYSLNLGKNLYSSAISGSYAGSDTAVTMMRTINPDWASNQTSKTTYASLTQYNEKETAWLCDVNNWSTYVDTSIADWAIGSPSVEMYLASYNSVTHATNNVGTLGASYRATSYPGYVYTINESQSTVSNSDDWTGNETVDYSGYNSMYCGYNRSNSRYWWWLASPSARGSSMVLDVGNGTMDSCDGYASQGVCPLVALKSGVSLEIVNK